MTKNHAFFSRVARAAGVLAVCGLFFFTSCDDEEQPDPVTVNFSTGDISITENGGPQTITLSLSKAAFKTGAVSISTSEGAGTYLTVPSEVEIAEGATAAQFNITPVDNATINGSHEITLTLTSAEDGFLVGAESVSITITVLDDEGAVTATFTNTSGSVSEGSADGVTVAILLSSAADVAGTVVVTVPASEAFTTEPAVSNGTVTIPVAVGATSASFKVKPVDNTTDEEANPVFNFTISSATGGVNIGGSNLTYALTIEDNDNLASRSIAEVRALYTGTTMQIASNISVSGTVISSNDNTTSRNLWLNDGTTGILVRFDANNTFAKGDQITIKLKGVTLQEFNGVLELGGSGSATVTDLPLSYATKTGTATLPAPQTITIAQLLTKEYEGKLVKIENVSFPAANGVNTLQYNDNGYGAGNNKFTDGTNIGTLRVESYAPFKGNLLPFGSGTLYGIASEFTTANSSIVQITPQAASDIFASNATASITVSATSLDAFGDVNKGQVSASKNFTVSGTGLTADITVTAPNNFTVSLQEAGTYSASVTVPFGDANLGPVTVYVKFAPNSGANQTLSGNISLTSTGADAKSVAVTGNEIGNAVATLLLNEHFDYATGQLTNVNSGANVSGDKWTNFSGTSNVINVVSGSLSYSGYASPVGNKVTIINGSAEDAYSAFSAPVTTGKVYAAFLVNITSTTGMVANSSTTGDYFAGVLPSANATALDARVSVRTGSVAGTYNLGLRATSSNTAASFKTTDYATGTTHLIVISYEIVSGTTNDVMKMWIDPSLTGGEPTEDLSQTGAAGDLADVARFFLRQGTNAVQAEVDGIRVAQTWADLFN